MFIDRRQFLVGAACLVGATARGSLAGERKKIAFIGTEVKQHSHAQHFLDRLTLGYAWHGEWVKPRVEIASVYIDQYPENDLAKERIDRHKLKSYPTVAEALTLGGEKLAVDGVVIIGEHGKYPKNEKGQTLYPRYKWFKEVVKVFEASGRAVPVFNDKHLSTDWNECVEMVEDAKRLKFPFMAGSSLPVTWRLPEFELPLESPLEASVCVAYGGVDSYDFHALETAQCISERRAGGECGVGTVQALRGDALWQALEEAKNATVRELMVAALRRSHTLPVKTGYMTDEVTYAWIKQTLPDTIGYLIEHLDGFRTAIFLTGIQDFNYAGKLNGKSTFVGCQMHLPMPGRSATTADFFTPLIRHFENTVIDGTVPYPVERTLLTSGMVIAAVESLHRGGARIETPEMNVRYKAMAPSAFWRQA